MEETKKSKGLIWLLVILIILGSALIVLVVYKEFFAEKLENNNLNITRTTETTTTNKLEETKKLTNEEIEKYLSYVPLTQTYENDAYSGKNYNVNTINQEILMENTFLLSEKYDTNEEVYHELCGGYCEATEYVKIEEFNKTIKEMYNLTEKDLKHTKFAVPGGQVDKGDKYYALELGAGSVGLDLINNILNYRVEDNELIITEQAGIIENGAGDIRLFKNHNENSVIKVIEIYDMSSSEEEKVIKDAEKNMKENLEEYPIYKHTFKQHEDGTYYWYSTELTND